MSYQSVDFSGDCPTDYPKDYLSAVRAQNPLIHNITNLVSANFTANGLLAIGASPMMADTPDEVGELASVSQALVLNLGTPNAKNVNAILSAGASANLSGIPVVLDPVAVGASRYRQTVTERLLTQVRLSAVRGNAAEIAHLAGVPWQAKGVDAGTGVADLGQMARLAAKRLGCPVVLTGRKDFVSDGEHLAVITSGTPLLPKVTASGCLLSAVCGAFLAVAAQGDELGALAMACASFGVAGQLAAVGLEPTQSGAFMVRFIDALAAVTTPDVMRMAHIELGGA